MGLFIFPLSEVTRRGHFWIGMSSRASALRAEAQERFAAIEELTAVYSKHQQSEKNRERVAASFVARVAESEAAMEEGLVTYAAALAGCKAAEAELLSTSTK